VNGTNNSNLFAEIYWRINESIVLERRPRSITRSEWKKFYKV
jgi:hypothetical protein